VAVKVIVLALMMLQVVLIVESKICNYAYYAKQNQCVLCNLNRCGIGEGLEKNCGHDENGNMIPGKSRCRKCSVDEYMMKYMSTTVCIPCNKCYGKRFRVMCSATTDAVCEDCPKGFYERNNNCYKCSRCCDGPNKVKSVQKCLDDDMPQSHSCSQDSNCQSLPASTRGIPTTIQTTVISHTSKSSQPSSTVLKKSLPKKISSSTAVSHQKSKSKLFSSTPISTKQSSSLKSEARTSTQKSISKTPPQNSTRSVTEYLTTQVLKTQPTTEGKVQKETTTTRHNSIEIEGNIHQSSTVKPFLLVVALLGVLIIIVLVLMCAKSRKSRRDPSKETVKYHKQPQDVRISLSSTREEEEEKEEKEEKEVYNLEHFPADSMPGNKAVPYGPNGSHWYFDAEDRHFENCTKSQPNQSSRGIKNGEGSRSSSSSRLSGSSSHDLGATVEHYDGTSFTQVIRSARPKICRLCRQKSSNEQLYYDEALGVLKECQKTTIKQSMDPCKDGITSWKEVATYFHVPQETIDTWNTKIKSGDSPTESLLYYLNTQNITISLLLECLKELERFDVHDSLLNHLRFKCHICR